MFPFLALVAVATALMGMLNSLHRFFIPAVSPAMFNVGSIVCTLGLAPVMPLLGSRSSWPGIGVLVGGFLQMAVQWPALRREGYRYRPVLDFRDEGLRRVLVLMDQGWSAWRLFRSICSSTASWPRGRHQRSLGAELRVQADVHAHRIFGVSIATAVVPTLSRHAARNDAPACGTPCRAACA